MITIGGSLSSTVDTVAHSAKPAHVFECEGCSDSTRSITTTYELIALNREQGRYVTSAVFVNLDDADEIVIRVNIDNTNYIFFALPFGAHITIPLVVTSDAASCDPEGWIDISARTVSGTARLLTFLFW